MNISYVVPTYNSSETIEVCLKSIKNQMENNDELIVVDNGSKDNTLDIISRFDFVKDILVKQEIKVGQLRNEGAKLTTGDIVAFVDSDCVLASGWRERVVEHFTADDVDALGARYDLPDNPKWIERAWFSKVKRGNYVTNYINAGNFAIKSDVFFSANGFDPDLPSGEDTEFCMRLTHQGYVIKNYSDVSAVHLGNPKSIKYFFRQQYWHSLGMFGTFKLDGIDKPFFATVFFILFLLSSVILIFNREYLLSIFIIFAIPLLTVFYRCYSSKNWSYFFSLTFLYFVYFLSRSFALMRIAYIFNQK